ncbi:leptin-like [Periophthalmus magnuspinnatus]|uniref:leptin-like n=1 Tax=Periophthalmus magnuspinnatus TaxID=409849 RepID=UPI00145A108F|nr:leptin-like [Periophthalmus magnuspinnatus]
MMEHPVVLRHQPRIISYHQSLEQLTAMHLVLPPLSLLLLLSLLPLQSQMRTVSLLTEADRMKGRVEKMAKQLVRKINDTISIPPPLATSSPSGEHYVCCVVQYLNISSGLISNNFYHALDLKEEMASLSGFVDQAKQCHCSSRSMKEVPRELRKLQERKHFFHSITLSAFHLVKEYLKKLQTNLGQLDKCTE